MKLCPEDVLRLFRDHLTTARRYLPALLLNAQFAKVSRLRFVESVARSLVDRRGHCARLPRLSERACGGVGCDVRSPDTCCCLLMISSGLLRICLHSASHQDHVGGTDRVQLQWVLF